MKPEENSADISPSLMQTGMDPSIAIELRCWWKPAYGLDISVLEIMGSSTPKQVGKIVAELLQKELEVRESKKI